MQKLIFFDKGGHGFGVSGKKWISDRKMAKPASGMACGT